MADISELDQLHNLNGYLITGVVPMPTGGNDRTEQKLVIAPDEEYAKAIGLEILPGAVTVTVEQTFVDPSIYKLKPSGKPAAAAQSKGKDTQKSATTPPPETEQEKS